MKSKIFALLAITLICFVSCRPTVDLEAERDALLQTDRNWAAAAKAGDLERLWSFWSGEAIIYRGDSAVRSLAEIKEFVRRNRSQPGFSISWEPEGAVVAASGDLGYTYGLGQITVTGANGKPVTMTNYYVSIWKKQPDGTWKCIIET